MTKMRRDYANRVQFDLFHVSDRNADRLTRFDKYQNGSPPLAAHETGRIRAVDGVWLIIIDVVDVTA